MSIRQRLAAWLAPPEQRSLSSWDLLRAGAWGIADDAGQVVTHKSAEHGLSTITACIQVIASAIASLPARVYVWQGDRRVEAPSHPLQRLIDRGPNPHQSWADWCEWTLASVLLRGNAISEIVTDQRGALIGLVPIPWDVVAIVQLPGNRIAYEVTAAATGGTRRLLQGEVFHLRDRNDDGGPVGVSRLHRAAGVVGAAQAQAAFAARVLSQGFFPAAVITADSTVGAPQFEQLQQRFRSFAGLSGSARALILDQSLKYQSVAISPEDAELLASRKFTVAELCRIYGTPPPLVQDYSHNTFTNSQEASRWFASNTLAPWVCKIQLEAKRSLFTSAAAIDHELTLDMADLMRGSPLERWQANEIAVRSGVLDPDEIRIQEGFAPRGEAATPLAARA